MAGFAAAGIATLGALDGCASTGDIKSDVSSLPKKMDAGYEYGFYNK